MANILHVRTKAGYSKPLTVLTGALGGGPQREPRTLEPGQELLIEIDEGQAVMIYPAGAKVGLVTGTREGLDAQQQDSPPPAEAAPANDSTQAASSANAKHVTGEPAAGWPGSEQTPAGEGAG